MFRSGLKLIILFLTAGLLIAFLASPAIAFNSVAALPPQAQSSIEAGIATPPPIPLIYKEDGLNYRYDAPLQTSSLRTSTSTTFAFNFVAAGNMNALGDSCLTFPDNAKNVFYAAALVWADLINSSVPITIQACWANLPAGVLGHSATLNFWRNFPNAPRSNTWYPQSLADALSGATLSSSFNDISIAYANGFSSTFYYGTDGHTPAGQIDFMSVVLHEIAHGLGFAGSMTVSGGNGYWGFSSGDPFSYDTFAIDSQSRSLINTSVYPNPSWTLASALTSNGVYFIGTHAMAANGGTAVQLYAPGNWVPGSSYSHLDYSTYNGTPNTLMVYAIGPGSSIHNPGPVGMGVLNDVGWPTGNAPGDFAKAAPANAATGVSTSPTLSWGTSTGATFYEYCYSTSNTTCTTWTSTAANTSIAVSGLSPSTPYVWQVRAVNSFGTTYAEGASTAFWSFTTGNVPGAFVKTAPAKAATGVSITPTLSWGTSTGATSYEYCFATSAATCTTWTTTAANPSIVVSGLSLNTAYYWQVRAVNSFGTTYANGTPPALWTFTTGDVPGPFAKIAPTNTASGVSTSPMLSWGTSIGATSYEYCFATSAATCTTWTRTAANTNADLSGLSLHTLYFWQVRAMNSFGTTYANGSANAFWSFTPGIPSAAFWKVAPANAATWVSISPTLSWGTSTGATSYEYCYATSAAACTTWTGTAANTSVILSGLGLHTTYYWQVRANKGVVTTYADGSATAFFSFTTGDVPAAFGRIAPANAATKVSINPTLSWETSSGATSYEYCYSTSNTTCTTWTSTGANTSVALNGLGLKTTFYWQARAVNSFGTTDANGTATGFWSFTTGDVPGAFAKTAPANAAVGVSTSPTLTWGASAGATSYEYCYDTPNDGSCAGTWLSADANTSVNLVGLSSGTTYYWQVRAKNSNGTTYANGNWLSFTTILSVYLPIVVR